MSKKLLTFIIFASFFIYLLSNQNIYEHIEKKSYSVNNPNTVKQLLKSGYVKNDEPIYKIELEDFGEVELISGYFLNDSNCPEFELYLSDMKGNILYSFPKIRGYDNIFTFHDLLSISHYDLNGDKRKDIIIICNFVVLNGSNAGEIFPIVNIMLKANDKFIPVSMEIHNNINSSLKIDSIEKVIEFFESKISLEL